MKKFNMTILSVLAVTVIAGGLTPVFADTQLTSQSTTQAQVQPTPASTTVASTTEVKVVAQDERVGILSVQVNQQQDNIRLSGTVSDQVTKLVLTKPNGDKLEILNITNGLFSVSLPAFTGTNPQYGMLEAFAGTISIDSEAVLLNPPTSTPAPAPQEFIFFSKGIWDDAKNEVEVRAVVSTQANKVFVTYGNERKEVAVTKQSDTLGTIHVTFTENATAKPEAKIEVLQNNVVLDAEFVELKKINEKVVLPVSITVMGKALITPNQKTVSVKGTITIKNAEEANNTYTLVAVGPDGKKHTVTLNANNEFELLLPYHDRSNSAKYIWFEVYAGDTLVGKAKLPYTQVKKSEEVKKEKKEKGKKKPAKVDIKVDLKVEDEVKLSLGAMEDDDQEDGHKDKKKSNGKKQAKGHDKHDHDQD